MLFHLQKLPEHQKELNITSSKGRLSQKTRTETASPDFISFYLLKTSSYYTKPYRKPTAFISQSANWNVNIH